MNMQVNSSSKKEQWKRLRGKQKLQYVWDYYKLPIAVCLIALYILSYTLYGHLTKKETLLYVGLVNISAGEQLTGDLSSGFIDSAGADASKTELKLYTGLYLTEDPDDPNHEYTYASRIKIMASIDEEKLDILLMNKEAYDAFSQNEYLCDIEELLRDIDPEAAKTLAPNLVSNGLLISQRGLFKGAGLTGDVYLGVVKNSPRLNMAAEYIRYLYSVP